MRLLLRQTFLFGVAIALNSVDFRATVIVMSLMASATQIGYFAISFRVVEVLIGVPALVMAAAFRLPAPNAMTRSASQTRRDVCSSWPC